MFNLLKNILIFFISILLLLIIGLSGSIYTVFYSLFNCKKINFFNYWSNIFYFLSVGVNKIGNVLLSSFLNKYAIINKNYPFGNINHTISHVLSYNLTKEKNNLTKFGLFIVSIIEIIDHNHMKKSI